VKVTRRLVKGLIAVNPGKYDGLGEWRYCHECQEPFFSRASEPASEHEQHPWSALPALDPEGQARLAELFRGFLQGAFSPERREELEVFAQRHGWDLAYELEDGGGALTAEEVERWRHVVEAKLEQLVDQAEQIIAEESYG
jgi:hypothetical protein